jgi:two-component system LytT family response regulator
MTKLRAIIVDDEKWARTVLSALLKRDFDTIEIVAECVDVLSAVEQIKKHKPDVVFLDIEMPNYAGYELVKFFDVIDFKIIFVTAFDKYAIKAFQINAIDYLVKPIDREKLKEAIIKLDVSLEKENKIEHYNELLKTISNKQYNKIVLPELGNRRIVDLDNIIAIKADGTYSRVYFKEGKAIVLSKTLKYFENLLDDKPCFFRSHRSWLINLKHLKSINKSENTIFMEADLETAISRSKFSEFEQIISQY